MRTRNHKLIYATDKRVMERHTPLRFVDPAGHAIDKPENWPDGYPI
jgi:hypothetical protein